MESALKKEKSDIRIDVPQENIEKFLHVFLYILKKNMAKQNICKTVLFKLLYFIDFDYYELFEDQLMGLKYIKNRYGPLPVDFERLASEMKNRGEIEEKKVGSKKVKYLPLVEPDLTVLSAQELTHIDRVLEKHSGKSAKEIYEFSHKDIPWIGAKNKEVLDYEAVFYRNQNTSVREYDVQED